MALLNELRSQRALLAACPSCGDEFRISEARLFDATKRLPEYAQAYLKEQYSGLVEEYAGLRAQRRAAKERPRIAAESINIGKVVEKVAPSLRGFPAVSGDCRSLFEPIDYVIFHGLSARGRIESLTFVDVKSGNSRLSSSQSQVKSLVECGKVRLLVEDHCVKGA